MKTLRGILFTLLTLQVVAIPAAWAACPTITVTPFLIPQANVKVAYNGTGQQLVATGGLGPHIFTVNTGVLPSGITLSGTGLLSGTPTSAVGSPFFFEVRATDQNGCFGSRSYSLVVNCPTITVNPATLVDGTTKDPYSRTLTGSGGVGPYTFTIVPFSGGVPPGLTLNASGLIDGIPSTAGSFSFTAQATDINGCTGTESYKITIGCPPITLTPVLPAGETKQPYTGSITASSTGTLTGPFNYAVTSGTFPAGLTLDPLTGAITGSPTTAGTFIFEVTFDEANNCSVTQSFTIVIGCPVITLGGTLLPGETKQPYNGAITATTPAPGLITGPLNFVVTAGTFPPGLTLDPLTGLITGNPTTAGTFTFDVSFDEANLCSAGPTSFTIVIGCPVITLGGTLLPGETKQPYNGAITATTPAPGLITGPLNFVVTAGTFPPGLTLDPLTGLITGNPTTAGTFTFDVSFDEANLCSAGPTSFTIVIGCPVITLGGTLLPGETKQPYNGAITATTPAPGLITGPLNFVVTAGTFPPGLTLDPLTGLITGNPTTAGTFTFDVSFDEANLCSAGPTSFTIVIGCPVITLGGTLLPGETKQPYNGAITATTPAPGLITGPLNFVVTAGTFPPGLTLDPLTGLITGNPTTAGTFTFDVSFDEANLCSAGPTSFTIVIGCPVITLGGTLLPGETKQPYNGAITATTPAPGLITGPLNFVVTAGTFPPGLTLDPLTGLITGNPTTAGTFTFDVSFDEANLCSAGPTSFTIVIGCPVITLGGTLLPGETKQPYNGAITATTPAPGLITGPLNFVVTAGTFPPGLTLDPLTGLITGNPTTAGTFTFDVSFDEANLCSAGPTSFTIVIGCPVITLGGTLLPGETKQPYNGAITATTPAPGLITGPLNFVVTAGTFPPGLTLDPLTGLITGNPTTAGTFTFDVSFDEANLCSAGPTSFTIVIGCPVITLGGTLLPGETKQPYNGAITATTPAPGLITGPLNFVVTAGTFPPGLTLDPLTGLITGNPTTAGTFTFDVSFDEANLCSAGPTSFTIVIGCPVITLGGTLLPGETKQPYNGAITATTPAPGLITGPLNFVVTAGTFPPGLTLDPLTGLITGNPTTAGTFTFDVSFDEANLCSAGPTSFTIVIGCPVITLGGTLLPGETKQPYNGAITATTPAPGLITGPLNFVVTAGTFPPGLTLDPLTGLITGNPTTAGTFTFDVSFDEANLCSAGPTSFTIVIGCPVITLGGTLLPGETKQPYNGAITATTPAPGLITGPLNFVVTAGTFPPGLTLDPLTGLITGNPTTAGTFTFDVSFDEANLCSAGPTSFTIVIGCPVITLTPALLPNAVFGVAYSQSLTPTSPGTLTSPYSFLVTAGALPGGLALDPLSGLISGTPTASGTFNFTVTFGEANNCGVVQSFTLVVPACVTAVSPANCITTSTPIVTVPIVINRGDATTIRQWHVKFKLSPELQLAVPCVPLNNCPSISNGNFFTPFVTANPTTIETFLAFQNVDGTYEADGAVSVNCGSVEQTATLFTVDVTNSGPDGIGTVQILSVVLKDCVTPTPGLPPVVACGDATVTIDHVAPVPIADLGATQVLAGNDGDGTTKVLITFTPPGGASTFEVFRAPFGGYPKYATGSVPSAPSYPPGAPWSPTPVISSPGDDETTVRDFYYYVAFSKDACGNVSAVSNVTGGTLNYHLGDVTDGATLCQGDNEVDLADISFLGGNYGVVTVKPGPDPLDCLDVGPTTTTGVSGRPLPDNKIDFEDLTMFAINFGIGPVPNTVAPAVSANGTNSFRLTVPRTPAIGETFVATIDGAAAGNLRAAKFVLDYDAAVVEPIAVEAGELLSRQAGPALALSARLGDVDVAVMGTDLVGEGEVARVTFRVKTAGVARVQLGSVEARDARNQAIDVSRAQTITSVPTETSLAAAYPNPFRGSTAMRLGLAHSGAVRLDVFDIQGRLVRNLMSGHQAAGEYSVSWDGRGGDGRIQSAGLYIVRFEAEGRVQTRRLSLMR